MQVPDRLGYAPKEVVGPPRNLLANRQREELQDYHRITSMQISTTLAKIQRSLAAFSCSRKLAVRVRNQANCILGYYLGESSDQAQNGERMLAAHLGPTCKFFVDVGANNGAWTAMWLESAPRGVKGVLFEPLDYLAERLRVRFGDRDEINVVCSAVSEQAGKAHFYVNAEFDETSSLLRPTQPGARASTVVEVCTLDGFFSNRPGAIIDFLKIDAEGFDGHVLRGATSLLSQKRIKAIQFEYNSMWAGSGSTLTSVVNQLANAGYDTYLIRSDGLHALDLEFWGEYFRYSNFFAAVPETVKKLKDDGGLRFFPA